MTTPSTNTPLPPGSSVGILGGGQLGQMLALAGTRLGLNCHIYTNRAGSPATMAACSVTVGAYDDIGAIAQFAKTVDVVTYEFENVPAAAAKAASDVTCLRPGARALDVAQDRLTEKTFISQTAGVPVTPFFEIKTIYDVRRLCQRLDTPVVIKTRRMGYDGKGQAIIREESDIQPAFDKLAGQDLIAEQFIEFKREVSIIAARSLSGDMAAYPLTENIHKDHILHISTAPAKNDTGKAQTLAFKIMEALDYVGVMATEFFQLKDGSLLVNEIAPRVHNSGHWTQNAGCIDQFELHMRAVAGWPLGSVTPLHTVQMLNLIGEDVNVWPQLAKDPDAKIHLYGKSETRPGRKMGHVNRIIE